MSEIASLLRIASIQNSLPVVSSHDVGLTCRYKARCKNLLKQHCPQGWSILIGLSVAIASITVAFLLCLCYRFWRMQKQQQRLPQAQARVLRYCHEHTLQGICRSYMQRAYPSNGSTSNELIAIAARGPGSPAGRHLIQQ